MNRMLFVLLPLILLLTACSPALAEAPLDPSATSSPTVAASSTPTFFPTPTQTPTATATATPTFTPTPTPITLPVANGTPIPDLPYEVVTAENVSRLRQIARYGYPRLLDDNPYRLTADGKTIAVGTTAGVEFYDAVTHEKTGGFPVDFLSSFDLTPDGRFVLTQAGDALTVWTREGKPIRRFEIEVGENWYLNAVALSPDGALLTVQRKRADWQEQDKVDVYRVSDGALLDTVRGNGALFSPDGKYLATFFGGSVYLYPVAELGEGWEKRLPKQTLPWCALTEEGNCELVFSPDGSLAALIRAGRVEVYRVEERGLVRQLSGWEVQDAYSLPSVQFSRDGSRVLIVTAPLYDAQYNVKQPSRAILVDVASGEWLSKQDVPEGFVYTDGEAIRAFRWQAEGEAPYLGCVLSVKVQDGKVVSRSSCDASLVVCVNQECTNVENKILGQDGKTYTVSCSDEATGRKCEILDEEDGEALATFSVPKEKSVYFKVFDGSVVAVEIEGSFPGEYVTARREDGKRAEIGRSLLLKSVSGRENIAFDLYKEGLVVLDVEQWTVKRYSRYSAPYVSLLAVNDEAVFVAHQDWEAGKTVSSVKIVDIRTGKSRFIPVPEWKMGVDGTVADTSVYQPPFLVVDSGGTAYVIDINQETLIHELDVSPSYSINAMAFSEDQRFFVTNSADGFIRVWAVVPEDAPVK